MPSETAAKCFFAKHPWHGLDPSVRRGDTGDEEATLAIDDIRGLIKAGVVEIHPWGSTIDKLGKTDRLVFDLDPGENVPWTAFKLGQSLFGDSRLFPENSFRVGQPDAFAIWRGAGP